MIIMITFEHTEVVGWEAAIRGMRNPLESWEKSDSRYHNDPVYDKEHLQFIHDNPIFNVGPNDLSLMTKLRKAGTDHRKFMRMITVYVDITAPLYWWKEFDTYKVGTVANSCSTMHTIHKKEFTLDDFSHEHLISHDEACDIWREDHALDPRIDDDDPAKYQEDAYEVWSFAPIDILNVTIKGLNRYRDLYLHTKDKKYWWQMIQLLPTSYNQKRTVMLNYEVLANIYKSRKDHKLTEWHDFCDWIKELPYSELITGESSEKNDASVETQEEHSLPSMDEINKLFNEVMRVDGRVRSYRVFDKMGMKILDFYDGNHKSLYVMDLYRTTLNEALAFIKEEFVKLTR